MVSLFIVLISGLTSEFVRSETIASRTFSAFCFTGSVAFILMMSCEEYAIFKTKRELEHFIDDATMGEAEEDFDLKEYLHEDEESEADESVADNESADAETAATDDTFRPMDFAGHQA